MAYKTKTITDIFGLLEKLELLDLRWTDTDKVAACLNVLYNGDKYPPVNFKAEGDTLIVEALDDSIEDGHDSNISIGLHVFGIDY